ncbi:phage shock protein C [Altererythrobacter atlanticus]|uniref:DNA-binding transcriptional activator PspC n=1 Tax=Croceibacterium atlanticum TaxID=1267766 RepID=A0A0F7KYG7_9SPHN|nr:envelope stress response membrane protein PspC [Croceibacterium atlanticum]AKH41087.1 DNA-binding transcriptional activator PspC [Croceibacterium atlanticum]MBB5732602.1 phage shock protein C [Croceibacterium atlanticum]
MTSERTKFYRDKQNAKLMGVCSGLEDYTGIDAIWWRLAFVILTISTGFGIPAYFALGFLSSKKPPHLYVDAQEQKYWQRVRQSPKRTAREIRARFRDIDRRLAEVETYYVTGNRSLSAEIEQLR